jgi:hypothetical protein
MGEICKRKKKHKQGSNVTRILWELGSARWIDSCQLCQAMRVGGKGSMKGPPGYDVGMEQSGGESGMGNGP